MSGELSPLRRWFSLPRLPSIAHTEAAARFHRVMLSAMGIVSLFLGLLLLVQPETGWRRLEVLVVFNGMGFVLLAANRKGHTRFAGWGLVTGIFAILTQRTLT